MGGACKTHGGYYKFIRNSGKNISRDETQLVRPRIGEENDVSNFIVRE
jgi:hypothetical protein